MSIDMAQFHTVFFEESLEGLAVMEQSLLEIDVNNTDDEMINTIFRAAHSIKGGSGTFGFDAVTEFTHELETLLDEVRDHKRQLDNDSVELLLKCCDCLVNMITSLQQGETISTTESQPLVEALRAILAGDATTPAAMPSKNANESFVDDLLADDNDKTFVISFVPEQSILMTGNEPLRIFRELESLGDLRVECHTNKVPDLESIHADECYLNWTLTLTTQAGEDDIQEVFEWVLDDCKLEITALTSKPAEPIAPDQEPIESVSIDQSVAAKVEELASNPEPANSDNDKKPAAASGAVSSSIRVGIDKVDSLINLVGELVITQSMLSELGNNFEMEKLERLSSGLEQLLQNTKELQESVMRIRMLPISFAFNRFPRMIRDLANKTGKKVELNIHGENTELDKTVMEKISDPLVHLVRNAIDHGIEPSEERLNAGKSEQGTITMDAYHQGGNIVIEISDDGRGLNTQKILDKAISKGIVDSNEYLNETRIQELIFEPGFSTADQVSDISGRGVGMDVVKRNIKALGGRIEVKSEEGKGSTFKVFLPLTLAILDGQLVRVGDQTYIVPLITIVESLQIKKEFVNRVSGNMVLYRLREDNVPIIPIYQEFGIEADNTEIEDALLVVVEGDGQKVGLLVDDLLAQQQVVIKSLESNYKGVPGISGATILGDGSVALILDIPGIITAASSASQNEAA